MVALDPRFVLLRKLKAGDHRGAEYQFVSAEQLAQLRASGRLLVETLRYGNTCAIDRSQVSSLIEAGQVPIVRMGNIPDIRRLVEDAPWLTVLLWVSREVCERRSRKRGDVDTAQRLRAWDETLADLTTHGEDGLALRPEAEQVAATDQARAVAGAFNSRAIEPTSHRA